MKLFAHRGVSAHALENTMTAFRYARRDGADGVELDVMCARSGEVVVFHDDNLTRLAGRPERIAELDWPELRAVRLRDGERIPLLAEVLEELRGFFVNIELKAAAAWSARHLAPAVVRVLSGQPADVLISSFNPLALAQLRALAPRLATGLLFHAQQARPLRAAWARHALRPTALHPEHLLVTPGALARWHREGYAVNVWTVDNPNEIGRLAQLGVDALITNDPARTRAILATPPEEV